MLALALTLSLLATPSARLVPEEVLLSAAEVTALDRELRILNGNIQELRPRLPTGYLIGMITGFSFSVLLLPGIPLLISSTVGGSAALLAFSTVLTVIGGVGLLAALLCLVVGNNAESDMADERAKLVERRDAIKKQLEPYQRPPPPVSPGYVPGVQRLDAPAPCLLTLARF